MNVLSDCNLVYPHVRDFSRRAGRWEYFVYSCTGYSLFAPLPFLFVMSAAGGLADGGVGLFFRLSALIAFVLAAAAVVLTAAAAVRRLHDLGFSGWWALLLLVPFFNVFFSLLLIVVPGNANSNRFGAPLFFGQSRAGIKNRDAVALNPETPAAD